MSNVTTRPTRPLCTLLVSLLMPACGASEPGVTETREQAAVTQLLSARFFVNSLDGYMDVEGDNNTASGARVIWRRGQLGFPDEDRPSQRIRLIHLSGDTAALQPAHSNKCLDVDLASHDPGAPLIQWDCTGGANQTFHVQKVREGGIRTVMRLVAQHSGLCLTASVTGPVTQQPCRDSSGQQWSFILDAAGDALQLKADHSARCLDVAHAGTANGTEVFQWGCQWGASHQSWSFVASGENRYGVVPRHTATSCLDVAGARDADGTNVHLWQCLVGGRNQLWRLGHVKGGLFSMRSVMNPDRCLDVEGAGTHEGANVHLWTCLGASNQSWQLLYTR